MCANQILKYMEMDTDGYLHGCHTDQAEISSLQYLWALYVGVYVKVYIQVKE